MGASTSICTPASQLWPDPNWQLMTEVLVQGLGEQRPAASKPHFVWSKIANSPEKPLSRESFSPLDPRRNFLRFGLTSPIGRGADCTLESGTGVTLSREMQTASHIPDRAVFALFGLGA